MIDRIAKIILTTQFKPGDKDDPESCARVIAGAIVADMETYKNMMVECGTPCDYQNETCIMTNPDGPNCHKITVKGYRVTK